MQEIGKMLAFLGAVMLILGLVLNLNPNWPKIPGDIYINKPGIRIYIPLTSAIVLSVILSILFNILKK